MQTIDFFSQLILATIANIIAGLILRDSMDGKQPSSGCQVSFEPDGNVKFHWSSRMRVVAWVIILLVMEVLLLWTE